MTQMQTIKDILAPLYNVNRRWDYSEECMLLQLIREPNHMVEVEAVVQYANSLTPHERKFFPQTMQRLLSNWCGILDTIAVANRAKASPALASASEKIHMTYELKRVEARIKALRTILDGDGREDATPAHREELKKLKSRRDELVGRLNLAV